MLDWTPFLFLVGGFINEQIWEMAQECESTLDVCGLSYVAAGSVGVHISYSNPDVCGLGYHWVLGGQKFQEASL